MPLLLMLLLPQPLQGTADLKLNILGCQSTLGQCQTSNGLGPHLHHCDILVGEDVAEIVGKPADTSHIPIVQSNEADCRTQYKGTNSVLAAGALPTVC